MSFSEVFSVCLSVLTNLKVIGACIAVILYLSFISYVTHYRKRPARPKLKTKMVQQVPAQEAPDPESADTESVEM